MPADPRQPEWLMELETHVAAGPVTLDDRAYQIPALLKHARAVQARLDEALAACAVMRQALCQFIMRAGPRAHRLGCECNGHDGDGITCKSKMDTARIALSSTAGRDELERRQNAERGLQAMEQEADVQKDRAERAENQLLLAEIVIESQRGRANVAEHNLKLAEAVVEAARYETWNAEKHDAHDALAAYDAGRRK